MKRLLRELYCLWVHGEHSYGWQWDGFKGRVTCFWCGKERK